MKHMSTDGGKTVTLRTMPDFSDVISIQDFLDASGDVRDGLAVGLAVDTETTGLDPNNDRMIELAIQPFVVDVENNTLLCVAEGVSWLHDPRFPIPAEATQVHGITDADVKNQSIDWVAADALFQAADFVIAHNAKFDRGFIEGAHKVPQRPWGCTNAQIEWDAPSKALQVLCAWRGGFFYEAHRALADCKAIVHLLQADGRLAEMVHVAREPSYEVWAVNSHISTKDILRAHKYHWQADKKCWMREVQTREQADAETTWLAKHVRCVGRIDAVESTVRYR